ncbi:DUF952 domain-containing protein [Ferruginibacter albus]|uniref:DUF952 domain-containing protein n=1 Tax=Ferruginibacter albus TaxID=2875540 RepID=UPI001CC4FCA4|nr:DUF952 domain-containing protein [Ferruginibacter albus]UAY51178.1 DUF952 domain-containing protein [Ferruginibacter albus]
MIYHVVSEPTWKAALDKGFYEAPSLATEGFIHTSKQEQVAGVLQRYYKDQPDLLLLHIDESKLTAPLKYELAPSVNQEFPHIYGPLNLDAVINITTI